MSVVKHLPVVDLQPLCCEASRCGCPLRLCCDGLMTLLAQRLPLVTAAFCMPVLPALHRQLAASPACTSRQACMS